MAITPGQSRTRSDGNEEVLRILQTSSIIGASPLDCLCHIQTLVVGGSNYPAKMQSVYFTAAADYFIVGLMMMMLYITLKPGWRVN